MKKILIFLCILLILNNLSSVIALCESGQININSASLEELDKLTGIGPVKAQAIIETRPFNFIDGLMDVAGIGEITLEKIKTQNLACVDGEEENVQEEDVIKEDESIQDELQEETPVKEKSTNKAEVDKTQPSATQTNSITGEEIKIIVLNPIPKDIKSETDKEQLNKNKLAIYGLIVFCILLVFLFLFKKRKEKNEFK